MSIFADLFGFIAGALARFFVIGPPAAAPGSEADDERWLPFD
jgi:hypothetical protein